MTTPTAAYLGITSQTSPRAFFVQVRGDFLCAFRAHHRDQVLIDAGRPPRDGLLVLAAVTRNVGHPAGHDTLPFLARYCQDGAGESWLEWGLHDAHGPAQRVYCDAFRVIGVAVYVLARAEKLSRSNVEAYRGSPALLAQLDVPPIEVLPDVGEDPAGSERVSP